MVQDMRRKGFKQWSSGSRATSKFDYTGHRWISSLNLRRWLQYGSSNNLMHGMEWCQTQQGHEHWSKLYRGSGQPTEKDKEYVRGLIYYMEVNGLETNRF